MTKIYDMFEKDIDRSINPVIKVGAQNDVKLMAQELDEYVVTQELDRNLEILYRDFVKGVRSGTDSAGVWISGDFGSGKSHFLKIISYLFSDTDIEGQKPLDFIKMKVSETVLPLMKEANKKRIQTILFDIDSESRGDHKEVNMVDIYLLVFNRMLGFSSVLAVANMERMLVEDSKYDLFQAKFLEVSGKDWLSVRNTPGFNRKKISDALIACGYDPSDSEMVSKSCITPFNISAKEFAELLKKHCDKQGPDYVLVFLADEVGQFISGDTQRMLKLQTITEEICIHCGGKVWNIVTSQEDMDRVISGVNNNDFSKIQGRFSTRIKMSTSDVKEVIEKRVLLKKTDASTELMAYYESHSDSIKNKLGFKNNVPIPLYNSKKEFAASYPFVSYQYDMLQQMLTQLRDKSRAGKNISNAARSMLKTFKETLLLYRDDDFGILVPMYSFYESLKSELDTPTENLFNKAERNPSLNKFDVNVLKTLFLVKYYSDGFTPNVDNITSMMISSFDQNRKEVQDEVVRSLETLASQTLIQRVGDSYYFLTNEEQEINREIKRQTIQPGKQLVEISRVAFGEIFGITGKYKFDSTHLYSFNRLVDGENLEGTSYDLNFGIITSSLSMDSYTLQMKSEKSVIFKLKDDGKVVNQCIEYLQTERYIKDNLLPDTPRTKRDILIDKEKELNTMKQRFKALLSDALQSADVYVNGSIQEISQGVPKQRADEAMKLLVQNIYSMMSYMRNPKESKDIETLFKTRTLGSFDDACGSEKQAIDSVFNYLEAKKEMHSLVRMVDVMDKYQGPPYGFSDKDVEWLIGLLFRHGKISLYKDSVEYFGTDIQAVVALDLLTKSKNHPATEIRLREAVSQDSIIKAQTIFQSITSKTFQVDESSLVASINSSSDELVRELTGFITKIDRQPLYPGRSGIQQIIDILEVTKTGRSPDLFKFIDSNEDTLRGLRQQIEDYREFFRDTSSRRALFDKGVDRMSVFEKDADFLQGDILDIHNSIKQILDSGDLSNLYKLNDLCSDFDNKYQNQLSAAKTSTLENLESSFDSYKRLLSDDQELQSSLTAEFESSKSSIGATDSISDLASKVPGFEFKAKTLYNRRRKPEPAPQGPNQDPDTHQSQPRNSITVKNIIPPLTINSEQDIESLVGEIRDKLSKKLRDGPFDIDW